VTDSATLVSPTEVWPLARRAREHPDWHPAVIMVLSPSKLRRALKAWKTAERGRRYHQVSAHVGIDVKTLSNWKSDPKPGAAGPDPGFRKLQKMAEFLGVRVEDITEPE